MTVWQRWNWPVAMASRWRRRRICTLIVDGCPLPVALRDVSGSGARVDIGTPLPLGKAIEMRHPDAGSIMGVVSEVREGGITLRFDGSEASIAFALGAIASDMTHDD